MEQGIVNHMAEDPQMWYGALAMEHEVADFLTNIQHQADFLIETYRDQNRYYHQCNAEYALTCRARQTEIKTMARC